MDRVGFSRFLLGLGVGLGVGVAVLIVRKPRRARAGNDPAPDRARHVEFTEDMKGFVQLGESDCERGEQDGKPLMVHLTIRTEDIDFFLADPLHRAAVTGYIEYEPLGGRLTVEAGEFQCLTDAAGNSRQMRYRLLFSDANSNPHTLHGVKFVRHDGIQNVWRDTSTLFTKIYRADLTDEEIPGREPEAAGIIHIHPLDFLEELGTFRGDGVVRFGKFFFGQLWDIYKPTRPPQPERRVTQYTLRGVENAEVSTHYLTTGDHLTLSMLRFQRGPCQDVVVLLHGLTTSTDMFIMPEHYNLVNYLLDHAFSDVWSFDWRGSMRYNYDLFPEDFTMDDIALYDMPAAFSKIRQVVGPEARIHVICHCVGSLTFMMSLYAKRVDGIASVISNSLSLTPQTPAWSKVKLFLAPKLLPPSVDLSPQWPRFPLFSLGRALAWWISLWHPSCDVRACHMVSFMWGSGDPAAWLHPNLHEITHQRTADLFGSVNMGYFRHIHKLVSRGVAVKMYPNDSRYDLLPDNYLDYATEIDTPVLFVEGEYNRIFTDSSRVMYETINRLKPDNRNEHHRFLGYGHQDVFMGKNSAQDTFPVFLNFLQRHSGGLPDPMG